MMSPDLFSRWGCFIEGGPIRNKLSDYLRKLRKLDRFPHVAVGAKTISVDEILLFQRGRKYRDRYEFRSIVGAHSAQHFQPIDFRKIQINQNDGGHICRLPEFIAALCEQVLDGFQAVSCNDERIL